MKRILSLIALSLISFIGFSQTKGISYQAVIIDPNPIEIPGKDVAAQPYVSKDVWIRFGIYAGTTLQYEELHKTKTDEYGLVNLMIGGGVNTGKAGTFTSLSWDGITKNIVTNVSFDQGGRYNEVSNQKLTYVPYTLLAETAVKLAGVLPIASGGTGATNAIAARTNLGLGNVDNTADVDKPVSIATLAILDTKESLANKSTNIIADSASIVKYPSVKAIKDYVDARTSSANNANLAAKATALETPRTINGIPFDGTANITIPVGVTPPDANATTKGLVKLAGDLTGTADAPAIAASAVTTAKIADGAVTDGKITSVSGSKVTGNITGNAANVTGTVAISNGGTGATTASGARTNLGLVIGTDVLAQRTFGTAANSAATDFVAVTEKGANNGVATLGVNGKIPSVQIPSISFQSVSVVNSDATMTAIAGAQVGSIAIRSDLNINYVLSALPATTLSNWIQLAASTDVSTINGIVGPSVNLTTNEIPEGNTNKYYTDARVRGALSATGPLALNASTGVISMTAASATSNGYLSSADFTTFNNKQTALTAGVDYATPSGNITGNAANVTGIVAIANGGTGASTATGALVALGAEPSANKSNDVDGDGSSITKFPTVKSIKDYVDRQSANAGVADNSITSAKINGTIAIAKGGTGASTAAGARTNLGLVIGTDVMAANATTALTGDVSGSGNGSFATTVNSVGGVSSSTIATLPTNVAANTASITANTNSIATLNTNVSANTSSITANTTAIATNTASIATNATAITTEATTARAAELILTNSVNANTASITANTNSIATLNTNVSANTTSITANSTAIATNTASIATNATAITTEATTARSAELTLTNNVNANTASITANTNSIATLNTNVSANTTSITANSTDIATINTNLALKAPLASPAFTGTPTAPTPATNDNSTKVATTEYVKASITAASAGLSTIGAISGTSNAKGATISGTSELILTPADASNGGVVTTGAQTFAGAKTFTNTATFGTDIKVNGMNVGRPGMPTYTENTALGFGVLGSYAPTSSTYSSNTGVGNNALRSLTNGGNNTAVGHNALYYALTSRFNTALGTDALVNSTESNNVGIGASSGVKLTTGRDNVMVGYIAGFGMTTGSNNTIVGSQTYSQTAGAIQIGLGITTGSNNTIIGSKIFGLAPSLSNNVILADGAGNIRAQHDGTTGWTLGTITSGVWSATTIDIAKGGTGATTAAAALTNLGAEASVNKSTATDLGNTSPSDVLFPTQKAVKTYVDAQTASAGVSDGSITNAKLAGSITSSKLVGTDITTVGTITSGTWSASVIDIAYGGTGSSTVTGAKTNLGLNNVENTALSTWTGSTNITTVGALTAQTKTFMFQDLILGYGANNQAKIQTDASTKYLSFYPNYNVESTRMWPSGNVTIQTGGTFTDNGYKLEVAGTSKFTGNSSIVGNLDVTGNITSATWSGTTIPLTKGGTGATTAADARTNLGLVIGTDVMAANYTTTLTGDVTGAGNGSFATTLAASGVTSGTYGSSTAIPVLTVDTKGRVTSASTVGITAGVSTLAYSTTGASNGGTISGTTLTLTAADASNPGLISTGAQTIAGAKTFSSDVTATNFLGNATTAITAGNITATANTTLTSLVNLATVGTITAGTWSATEIAIAKGGTGATTASGARTNLGLGSLATSSSISNADVASGAAIAFSKLNISKADITGLGIQDGLTAGSGISLSSGTISVTGLTSSNLSSSAGITVGQLATSTTNLGSTTMTLGGTVTSVTGLTSLTATTVVGSLSGTATTATNIAGGTVGAIPYQSSAGTTAILSGNTSSTVMYLTSSGNGTVSTAPTWATLNAIPYTGATAAVDLGLYDLKVNGLTVGRGKSAVSTNTAVGSGALNANTSGNSNSAFGNNALLANTTGYYNSGFGSSALSSNISGVKNTALGFEASKSNTTGEENVAIGYLALSAKTAASSNVAIGSLAMSENNSTFYRGVAVGAGALRYTNESDNIAIGSNAGGGLGFGSVTGGLKNIFIGSNAGSGFGSGASPSQNTTGNSSVFIGHDVRAGANGQTNQIVISGYTGTEGTIGLGSHSTLIGNSATTTAQIMGDLTLPRTTASTSTTSGALKVAGGTGIAGSLNVGGSATISSTLTAGATTLASSTITGNETVGGTLGVTGATTLASTLTAGTSTLTSLSVTNNETVGGTLGVTGATTLASTLTAGTSTLTSLSVTNNESVGGTLGVTGATTLSTLTASGNSTLTSLTATGAATFSSTVTISTGAGLNKVLTSDANGGATWNANPNAAFKIVSSSTYTVSATDDKYVIYTNAATGTISLPAITSTMSGKEIIIKNISNFNVTINANGTQKIVADFANNTATSATLGVEASNNWVKLIADGTNSQWILFRALF